MEFIPSNLPIEDEYPKLVRDRIPEIIRSRDGVGIESAIAASDEQFLAFLTKKLIEESTEVQLALKRGNLVEELADVMELIDTVMKVKNLSLSDVLAVQNEKRAKNGGFNRRLIMLKKHQRT
jgi:predicted house-cleaning noncanonical NTP pyrophosphatase (MazG superfamily)